MANTYTLDGRYFTDKEATYTYLQEVFKFPDYFSPNLDALYDALSDLNYPTILLKNARYLPEQLARYGLKILDVFGDLQATGKIDFRMEW